MVERPTPKIFLYLYSEIVKINSYTPYDETIDCLLRTGLRKL